MFLAADRTASQLIFRHGTPHAIARRGQSRALPQDSFDPEGHVTEYTASAKEEDYAEVFYLFLIHKGRLRKQANTPVILAKWPFGENLHQAIEARKQHS